MTDLVGTIFDGKYEIIERIGRGGMGAVYRARHSLMHRTVAIKVLAAHAEEDELFERFKREAKAASSIEHPNAISIYDFGICDDAPYLVMQYIEGQSLKQALRERGAFPAERILKLAKEVASAMHVAHERGIVHRDLKPDNIMLTKDGEAVVLDFGIAKVLDAPESSVTRTGNIVGTPQYISPEQVGGKELDGRSDIYSLGVILYEMTTGRVPFEADSVMNMLMKHIREDPPAFRTLEPPGDVPASLERIIMKMLEKDPASRHQSMAELLQDLTNPEMETVLQTLPSKEPITSPKRGSMRGWLFAAAAGMLSLLICLSIGFQPPQQVASITEQRSPREILQTQQPERVAIPVVSPRKEKGPPQFDQGLLARKLREFKKAEVLLKEAIIEQPQFLKSYTALGDLYISLGRLSEAREILSEGIKRGAKDAQTYAELGYVYGELGQFAEAAKVYQESTNLRADAVILNNLGHARFKLSEFEAAEAAYKKAIQLKPSYARAYHNLADVYAEQNQLDKAVAAHKLGVRAQPDDPRGYRALGKALELVGREGEAKEAYNTAKQLSKG